MKDLLESIKNNISANAICDKTIQLLGSIPETVKDPDRRHTMSLTKVFNAIIAIMCIMYSIPAFVLVTMVSLTITHDGLSSVITAGIIAVLLPSLGIITAFKRKPELAVALDKFNIEIVKEP